MLRPIVQPFCGAALHACRRLQEQLLAWLCDPAVSAGEITQANLQPTRVPTQIEADWLWHFLQKADGGRTLLDRALVIAGMSLAEKAALRTWGQAVAALAFQFQPNPSAWPRSKPEIPDAAWQAFRELMEAFYRKALRSGLPYAANGTPVTSGGMTYAGFLQAFRAAHQLNPVPHAREVCVLCGGPLGQTPEVDHWIAVSAFPLLSVCADNLLPICGECNSTSNKGDQPVHTQGVFDDWFHPYLRPGHGALHLDYVLQTQSITCAATDAADTARVTNLDKLLNLASRWTREFKAEYAKQQSVLIGREKRRIARGQTKHTQAEIRAHLLTVQNELVATEPFHEVHRVLCAAMLEQSRVAAWQTELGLVT